VTALDIVHRLRHHGIRLSVRGTRIVADARVPPPAHVGRVLRRHRAALIGALRGRDVEIEAPALSARDRESIGCTHKVGDSYTMGDGDGPLVDLLLGLTTIEQLAKEQEERLHRYRGFLRGLRGRAN
jgi:hypothetical protein